VTRRLVSVGGASWAPTGADGADGAERSYSSRSAGRTSFENSV
jgi:hypothetical protein